MTRKLVSEFNELHRLGTDLDGNLGDDFFSLEGIQVIKVSDEDSQSQISIAGSTDNKLGESFTISYDASQKNWSLKNVSGEVLGQFENAFDFDGIKINISGTPSLVDKFNINFTDRVARYIC